MPLDPLPAHAAGRAPGRRSGRSGAKGAGGELRPVAPPSSPMGHHNSAELRRWRALWVVGVGLCTPLPVPHARSHLVSPRFLSAPRTVARAAPRPMPIGDGDELPRGRVSCETRCDAMGPLNGTPCSPTPSDFPTPLPRVPCDHRFPRPFQRALGPERSFRFLFHFWQCSFSEHITVRARVRVNGCSLWRFHMERSFTGPIRHEAPQELYLGVV